MSIIILQEIALSIPFFVLFYYLLLRLLKITDAIWKRTLLLSIGAFFIINIIEIIVGFAGILFLSSIVSILFIGIFHKSYLSIRWPSALLSSLAIVVISYLFPGIFILLLSGIYGPG